MILAASMEFEKGHCNEVVERPSDNEEIPMVSEHSSFYFDPDFIWFAAYPRSPSSE
jgi:hypothetical protein